MVYAHKRLHFALYFIAVAAYGILILGYPKTGYLSPGSDGGVIQYAILNNLQKVERLDFDQWTDRRIFYPNKNTLAYTEHFYLHSLLGSPYYFLTHNPEGTYVAILGMQLLIAITGFYFVGREISPDLLGLIASGLFFTYLPAFVHQHAQINFYGFLPWMVFFALQFSKTGRTRYIFLSLFAWLLQMLVGIYLQLFSVVFCPLFFLIFGLYLHKRGRLRPLFSRRNVLACVLSGVVMSGILLIVNKPYLDFRREIKKERSVSDVDAFAPDPVTYLNPSSRPVPYPIPGLWNHPRNLKQGEINMFLGFAGLIALLAGCAECIAFLRKRSGSPVAPFCVLFMILLGLFSLGPYLHLEGVSTGIRMPYYYLHQAHFIFRSIRVTSRIVVLMSLPLSLLVCWCFCQIKNLRIPAPFQIMATVFLAVLVLLDSYSPFYRWDYSDVHRLNYIYQQVQNSPGEVLLELPSGRSCKNLRGIGGCRLLDDGYYSFMHYYHNKWTVNGNSGYIPPSSGGIIANVDRSFDDSKALEGILREKNIDMVLIHRTRIARGYRGQFQVFLEDLRPFCKVVYRDDSYVLLAVKRSQYPARREKPTGR